MKKILLLTLMTGGVVSSGAVPADVVEMWKCPMPQKGVAGAGYKPVKGVVHSPVFKATMETGGYNHHAKIVHFKNKFYAMWSNHKYGEDGPGQKIYYSSSDDGKKWTPFKLLFSSMHKEAPWGNVGINLSAQKWLVQNGKLYAQAWCGETVGWSDRNRSATKKKRSKKFCFAVRKKYRPLFREVYPDGKLGPVASFRPEELPKDILVKVADAQKVYPGLQLEKSPLRLGKLIKSSKRRMCEPTWFKNKDGEYVILFRDDSYSHRKWVAYSKDGKKWTALKPTNIPDSPSASISLTLDDGTILLIGNHMAPEFDKDKPRHFGRDPLMVSISKDGMNFTKSYAIRSGQQKYTVPKKVVRGRGGGAQYPCAIIVGNTVYVIYSQGKEDIWVSSFPISAVKGS